MDRVFIAGGGAAGMLCASILQDGFDVTLAEKKRRYEFIPDILSLINRDEEHGDLQRHEEMLPNVSFIHKEVTAVSPGLAVAGKEHEFDYLVLCTGSSLRGAFDSNTISPYSYDSIHSNLEMIRGSESHLVIGGGPVGVELMGELMSSDEKNDVLMVHGGERILNRMGPKVSEAVMWHYSNRGGRFALSKRVVETWGSKFILDDGEEVEADLAYMSTGFRPVTDYLAGEYAPSLSPSGHVKVNHCLQIQGHQNAYAVGDITAIRGEKTYIAAERQAKVAAGNIVRTKEGKTLSSYRPLSLPMLLSLGSDNALLACGDHIIKSSLLLRLKRSEGKYVNFKLGHARFSKAMPI